MPVRIIPRTPVRILPRTQQRVSGFQCPFLFNRYLPDFGRTKGSYSRLTMAGSCVSLYPRAARRPSSSSHQMMMAFAVVIALLAFVPSSSAAAATSTSLSSSSVRVVVPVPSQGASLASFAPSWPRGGRVVGGGSRWWTLRSGVCSAAAREQLQ